MIVQLIYLVIIILNSDLSFGKLKTFSSSWDFSNPQNWKNGAVPCAGRAVTFGIKPSYPIFLSESASISSLNLPYDAALVLGDETVLSLDPTDHGKCRGSSPESVFVNKAKGWWWDPDSWTCDEDILDCNLAVPHLHRVPCTRDSVQFPDTEDSMYRILFTAPTPTVVELLVGKKNFTTSQFTAFAQSDAGRQVVEKISSSAQGTSFVYIEGDRGCSQLTGCLCHENSPEREICRITSLKCPEPQCSNPIRMTGFCCDTCGVEISISHNNSLSKEAVVTLLRKTFLSSSVTKGVHGHVAKIKEDGFVRVYFVAARSGSNYLETATLFAANFNKELNKQKQHKLQTSSAGEQFVTAKRRQQSKSTAVGVVFAILIVGGALVVVGYFFKKKRGNLTDFTFRRFSLRGRRESTLSTVNLNTTSTGHGVRFTNPMYNVPEAVIETDTGLSTSVTEAIESEHPTQRANPLFEAQERKEHGISLSTLKEVAESEEEINQDTNKQHERLQPQEPAAATTIEPLSQSLINIEEGETSSSTEESHKINTPGIESLENQDKGQDIFPTERDDFVNIPNLENTTDNDYEPLQDIVTI